MTHLMVYLGLLGLIASFHGIVMGCSRQVYALARDGILPKGLAALHPRFRTPTRAIAASVLVGIAATLRCRRLSGHPAIEDTAVASRCQSRGRLEHC
jgi:amino acid transporter